MKASEAAMKAAALISEKGLAKKQLTDSKGQICHNEAIFRAATMDSACDTPLALEVIDRSRMILKSRGAEMDPYQFNDENETSAEDVILLLKENAALDDDPEAMKIIEKKRESGDYEMGITVPQTIFSTYAPYTSIFSFSVV